MMCTLTRELSHNTMLSLSVMCKRADRWKIIVIFLRMFLTFFSLPSRYFGIIFDMSAQESRIDHPQRPNHARKTPSVSKNVVKQAGVKKSNTRSITTGMEETDTKFLTGAVDTVSMDQKWSKTKHDWKAETRSRSGGVRTTRQIRRNERERGRKARLNAAFQVLRSVVPRTSMNSSGTVSERKMTQVEILRLAKNYISSLTEILREDNRYNLGSFNA